MASGGIEAMYRSMPTISRALGTSIFVVTLASSLGFLSPSSIVFDWFMVSKKFQVWRLVTDYLYLGPFSFSWIFQIYLMISFSIRLEKTPVFSLRHNFGSYLYFLFINMLLLDTISLLCFYPIGRPLLGLGLSNAVIYYWSKKEPLAPVSLWGFVMTAQQFPFALLVLDLLMGQSLFHCLAGIVSGHIYYFIKDVLPAERNIHLLRGTPEVFKLLTQKLDFMPQTSASQGSSSQASTTSRGFGTVFNTHSANEGSSSQFPGRGHRLID